MSNYIVGLLNTATWEIIFSTAFFFGLLFFLLVIIGSFGDDDADIDDGAELDDGIDMSGEALDLDGDGIPDGIDLDGDGVLDIEFDGDFGDVDFDTDFDVSGTEIDLDGDGIADGLDIDGDGSIDIEFDADVDTDVDFDTDFDADTDMDLDDDGFHHVELNSTFDAEASEDVQIFESKYKMGNISSFLFFFGLVGWPLTENLQDIHVAISLAAGLFAMKAFAYFIANYTKTVVVPIKHIRRGDIAQVRYSVTPNKAGMILVARRDGVISTEMAKGAFDHDYFEKGEKGYVWNKEGGFYLITKGIAGQPDLNAQYKPKKAKKALDV